LYKQGRFADSIPLYRESLELRPNQPVVHFNLGLALYKSGKKREGRAEWQSVLELTDGKKPYLHEQASIMLRQFG
jgi:tetratricopeptide (TPR) repeat protein